MNSTELDRLLSLVPKGGEKIKWDKFELTALAPVLSKMAHTMQNPEYHGEGDVYTHTKLTCEALTSLNEYQNSTEQDKSILFLACLLHDIGKIPCTKIVDGALASPYHSSVGATMARELLWRELGLCGSKEKQEMREAICLLIRYHSFPPYAITSSNPELRLLKIASNGALAPLFSVRKLCLLERADILGRKSKDTKSALEKIEYCQLLSTELECEDSPAGFSSAFSQRAYFSGRVKYHKQDLYNDSWGEVILLSGLPGTGKDTYISKHFSNLPVISLDKIREETGISPTEKQGKVISIAHERAREYLRRRQPFVWNATSITSLLRSRQIDLFEGYGASVKTIFLETEWEENLRRNSDRVARVPLSVIEKMLSRLELPERFESQEVVWQAT